jgi:hypothetical protein
MFVFCMFVLIMFMSGGVCYFLRSVLALVGDSVPANSLAMSDVSVSSGTDSNFGHPDSPSLDAPSLPAADSDDGVVSGLGELPLDAGSRDVGGGPSSSRPRRSVQREDSAESVVMTAAFWRPVERSPPHSSVPASSSQGPAVENTCVLLKNFALANAPEKKCMFCTGSSKARDVSQHVLL